MTDSTNLVPLRGPATIMPPVTPELARARRASMRPILVEYWNIIQRRKWLILAVLAGSMVLALVATLLTRPTYTATTQVQTLRSPEYLDQIALLDFLCRIAPHGVTVATKEHPAMIGAVPSAKLLALAKRYDNFAILPPGTNNYAVLRKAERIVTVNSKSGAEAGLLGRRAIVLGDAFYRNAPFAQPVERLSQLEALLGEGAEQEPLDPQAVRGYFSALWQRTYPGELYALDPANIDRFALSLMVALTDRVPDEDAREDARETARLSA